MAEPKKQEEVRVEVDGRTLKLSNLSKVLYPDTGTTKGEVLHYYAQVAPTLLPEFQANVVAVETAPYWDDDLGALQQRMEELNAKMDQELKKDPSLSQAARDEAYRKAMAESFTPEELRRLKGISNGGYHYLGAAKILAPIGKAFAEAMAKLQATKDQ